MLKFGAQRALYSFVLLVIASVLVFVGLRITPGSVVEKLTTDYNRDTLGPVLIARFNLDKPISVQFIMFINGILRGDPGNSLVTSKPILDTVRESGVYTLILGGAGALLTYAIAVPLGVFAAARRNTIIDQSALFLSVLGMGVPNFFLALIFIQVFSVNLPWLPTAGDQGFSSLILPAFVLSAEAIALNVRLMRSSLLEELNREYIRTLRAQGLREWRVLWVHAFRNAH